MNPPNLVDRSKPEQNTVIALPRPGGALKLGQGFFTVIVNLTEAAHGEGLDANLQMLQEAGAGIVGLNMAEADMEEGFEAAPTTARIAGLDAIKQAGFTAAAGIMDFSQLDALYPHVDILHVSSRHMQNYSLLEALGRVDKPVILERSFAAKVEEWLLAAEYVMNGGNRQVILCESGIRTFESQTRRTLDVSAIAMVKACSHLPVIAYPGQATGRSELVLPVSKAAIAAGADGICVDVMPLAVDENCGSTGEAGIMALEQLIQRLKALAEFENREFLP